MKMKKMWLLLPAAAICLWASSAVAQGGTVQDGCVNSPENPTAVLALLGSAGAAGAILRVRLAGRKTKKQ